MLAKYNVVWIERLIGFRFPEAMIADNIIAVAPGAEHRGIKLRTGTSGIELESHAEVNRYG